MSDIQIRADIQTLAKLIANMAKIGVVAQIEFDTAKVKIEFDTEFISDWLPWAESLAGTTHSWKPPKIGDQAIVLAMGGNLKRGVVLGYLNQSAHPQITADGNLQKVLFANGSYVEVHETNNTMAVYCTGALTMHATGNMVISSDTDIAISAPHVGIND